MRSDEFERLRKQLNRGFVWGILASYALLAALIACAIALAVFW